MILPIGRCYSCGASSDELQNAEIHTGTAALCPKCFDDHARSVACKTKLIDEWQTRNRHLYEATFGKKDRADATTRRAWKNFWRKLFIGKEKQT